MDGRLYGNEISIYNFQEEVVEDVVGQGNIFWKFWNEWMNVEEVFEVEVRMLRDKFLKFVKDNFSIVIVIILIKDYVNEFKEVSLLLFSIDFYLQFIEVMFVLWLCFDFRVSKEILKGKVLLSLLSNCFLF